MVFAIPERREETEGGEQRREEMAERRSNANS